MVYKPHLTTVLTLVIALVVCPLLLFSSGCAEQLRFAASESQKQIALNTHLAARAANVNGAMPGSTATHQLMAGTETSLAYIGMPASPQIADYDATLLQARTDSTRRPDSNDVFTNIEKGLSLASALAIALGFGGAGVGGKKILDWIAMAKAKVKALEEVVRGNEILKQAMTPDEKKAFKDAQAAAQKTPSTPVLVAEIKTQNPVLVTEIKTQV